MLVEIVFLEYQPIFLCKLRVERKMEFGDVTKCTAVAESLYVIGVSIVVVRYAIGPS